MNKTHLRRRGLTAWFVVFAMLLSALAGFTVPANAETEKAMPDVCESLTSSVERAVADESGSKEISDGALLTRDEVLTLTLDYTLLNTRVTADSSIIYTLPSGIAVSTPITNGETTNTNGKVIGYYTASGNTIEFKFLEEFLTDNSNIVGKFSCDLKFDQAALANDTGGSFTFPGTSSNTTINVSFAPNPTRTKSVENVAGDGTVTYRIDFTPDANYDTVSITDVLGSNLTYAKDLSVVVRDENWQEQEYSDYSSAILNDNGFSFDLYNAEYGKTYIISYKAKIADIFTTDNTENSVSWNCKIGDNAMPAASVDGDTVSSATWYQVNRISKSGSYDSETKNIKWTITVNDGKLKANMKNAVVTDELSESLTAVSVTLDGNDILLSDCIDSDGKFSYTFPNTDDTTAHTFVITTKCDANDGTYINNTAKVDYTEYNQQGSDNAGVTFGATATSTPEPSLDALKKELVRGDEATGVAEWKITIDAAELSGKTAISISDFYSNGSSAWEFTTKTKYIADSFVVKFGDKTLVQDTDYSIELLGWLAFNLNFFDAVLSDITEDTSEDITIEYKTQTDTSYFDDNPNQDLELINTVSYGNDTASAVWKVNTTKYVVKSAKSITWDDELNAYTAEWEITFNGVSADFGSNPVTLTDTFANEGMEYVDGSMSWYGYDNNGGFITSGSNGYEVTPEGTYGGAVFIISNPEAYTYVITYKTKLPADKVVTDGNTLTLKNTVTAENEAGFSDTASAEKTAENVVAKKTAKAINNENSGSVNAYAIEYTVDVNRLAQKLNPNASTLTLSDVIQKDGVELLPATINVTDASGQSLDKSSYRVAYSTVSRELKVTVPDEQYLKVSYRVQLTGEVGDSVRVSNTAQLQGEYEYGTGTQATYAVQEAKSQAVGRTGTLQLTKIDEDDLTKVLEGAVFEFYAVNINANGDQPVKDDSTTERYTTNANGIITFGQDESGKGTLQEDTLYGYGEVTAPDGYVLDDTQFYFVIKGNNFDTNFAGWSEKYGAEFAANILTYSNTGAIHTITNKAIAPITPTSEPTASPTSEPTATPTVEPTATPSTEPTATPTVEPTASPTSEPTASPSTEPSKPTTPTSEPTATPTAVPTATPASEPTATPTEKPTTPIIPGPEATATATPDTSSTPETTPTPTVTPYATSTPGSETTATPDVSQTAAPTTEPTATPAPTNRPTNHTHYGGGIIMGSVGPSTTVAPSSSPEPTPEDYNFINPTETETPDDVEIHDSGNQSGEIAVGDIGSGGINGNNAANSGESSDEGIAGGDGGAAHEYTQGPEQSGSPKTGDNSMTAVWLLIAIITGLGALCLGYKSIVENTNKININDKNRRVL